MTERATLKFIGTAGSAGVPLIGCKCAVCTSTDAHNKRFRPSALIHCSSGPILIDCGPDFHQQALKYHIDTLAGLILTHAHHDHTGGVDELRVYYFHSQRPMPCLLSHDTLNDLKMRFHYIFHKDGLYENVKTHVKCEMLEGDTGVAHFLGLPVQYFTYSQGGMRVNGFRIGNLAYVTDLKDYDPSIFNHLHGLEHLVVSALRYTASPLHLSVDEAVDFAKRCNASHTWLTHLSHDLDHEKTNAYLPANVRLAYDGLELEFEF